MGEGKKLIQKILQKESAMKNIFNHAASSKSLATDIHAFWKSCIHTLHLIIKQNVDSAGKCFLSYLLHLYIFALNDNSYKYMKTKISSCKSIKCSSSCY